MRVGSGGGYVLPGGVAMVLFGEHVEGVHPVALHDTVWIGTGGQQELHHRFVPPLHAHHQRRPVFFFVIYLFIHFYFNIIIKKHKNSANN
jgi:hypothetical protein